MKKYEIGLYEKAMRNTLTWKEKLQCAKECGYDYLEISIDATEEKINRIYMDYGSNLRYGNPDRFDERKCSYKIRIG